MYLGFFEEESLTTVAKLQKQNLMATLWRKWKRKREKEGEEDEENEEWVGQHVIFSIEIFQL